MKCTLILNGTEHQSKEFSDRQVTLFMAASAGTTGINIEKMYQDLMGSEELPINGMRSYSSAAAAEADMDHVLAKVFPSIQDASSLSTLNMVEIAAAMLKAMPVIKDDNPTPTPELTLVKEPQLFTQPPNAVPLSQSESAIVAGIAAQLSESPSKLEAWLMWYRSVNDTDPVSNEVAFEIIEQFCPAFSVEYSRRVWPVLNKSLPLLFQAA